jgi:hypothetical protein
VPIPEFDSAGDLPLGVHHAWLDEVITHFGHGTPRRRLVTSQLLRVYELASGTGKLERFIIFGSYVTAKPDPNDVDIILVMRDDFRLSESDEATAPVFHHLRAQAELGASVFWTAPRGVLLETVDQFIQHWQIKRDHRRRGIVEVIPERRK